ncbi:MAG: nucleoside-diphosphate sugar epimerase, partial [Proteobacteria bacterium]
LSPPGFADQSQVLKPLIEQAKLAGFKKVVLMTAMGVDAVESSPLRQSEIALEKSGIDYNIIRPNWFMQNFNTFWLHGIQTEGRILLPVAKAKGSFIDARDIASSAVALLESNTLKNQAFDLTGADVLDHDEVAKILTEAAGRTITYQEITPEVMRQGLLGAGLPQDYAEMMLAILGFFKEGYSARTTNAVEQITGKKPIAFRTYAKDYATNWKK